MRWVIAIWMPLVGAVGGVAAVGAAGGAASAAGPGLTYVESSAGLEQPGMEGGRTELEFGDVNGDGHVDIVSIGDHGSPFVNSGQHGVMVWFGHGGQWSLVQTGDFGYGGVALGDVNNDGLMDVGYGMHHNYSATDLGDQLLEVALGNGTGTSWKAWDDGLATSGETWGMFSTDFADVDNDGDLDVGSISFGCCAGLHVYLNNGDGTWTQSFGTLGGNSSMEFVFGDVNGDGLADFAAAHGDGTVYLGDGAGGFTLADGALPAGPWRRGIALGDVDGDGADDLAFRTAAGVQVWRYGSGAWQDLSGALTSVGGFDLTQVADMDTDGHADVVAFHEDLVAVYAGDGAGGWTPAATIVTPDACDYAALRAGVDLDHNGRPDLAIVSEEDCAIIVGGTNRLRAYVEASVPAEPSVFPVRPRGGETWVAGSVRFIDWHVALPPAPGPPGPGTMTIELSVAGPGGPWQPVASGVPDNGRYQWVVPGSLPESSACHLRLTLDDAPAAVAITPGPFTITGGQGVPADLDGDGSVGVNDFLMLLAVWGPCDDPCPPACSADLDGDCMVGVTDMLDLLASWG